LPWYVDAYIALVPDSAMSRETGGSWFTLNAVQIRGNSWTLRRDSYECVGNSLSSIEGDGDLSTDLVANQAVSPVGMLSDSVQPRRMLAGVL
jgi:hypothetical protein